MRNPPIVCHFFKWFNLHRYKCIESFLDNFDIADVSNCRDAYMGCYENGAEFAQSIAEDCGEVGSNSSWIEIDWKASWDNLSYDYVESDNGHIFSQNF